VIHMQMHTGRIGSGFGAGCWDDSAHVQVQLELLPVVGGGRPLLSVIVGEWCVQQLSAQYASLASC
jgi:hypothetical protein